MPTETFTNEAIDIASLPKYEEISLTRPHADYWKIMCISFTLYFVFFSIIIALGAIYVADFNDIATITISGYLVFMVALFFILKISFKKRGYAIRTKDVIYKSGVIAESTTIVPLNRIQHIELNEGIFSRMYHLGTLQIFTAGGATGHLQISGIPIDEARSIRDLLLNKLDLLENQSTETQNG